MLDSGHEIDFDTKSYVIDAEKLNVLTRAICQGEALRSSVAIDTSNLSVADQKIFERSHDDSLVDTIAEWLSGDFDSRVPMLGALVSYKFGAASQKVHSRHLFDARRLIGKDVDGFGNSMTALFAAMNGTTAATFSTETLQLAMEAMQTPAINENIDEWASRLAGDISWRRD